jgi:hypothetical protein
MSCDLHLFVLLVLSEQSNSQRASSTLWSESNRFQLPVSFIVSCNLEAPEEHAMTHSHSLWSNHPGHYSIGSLRDGFAGGQRVESLTKIGNETPPRIADTQSPCESVLVRNWAETKIS